MANKNKTRRVSAAIAIAMLAVIVIASVAEANTMKIRITLNGKAVTATLIDSETTRDFISLLPLTLTMNDLFGREKFGHLPRAISEGGKRTRTYEIGDVIYWSPGRCRKRAVQRLRRGHNGTLDHSRTYPPYREPCESSKKTAFSLLWSSMIT